MCSNIKLIDTLVNVSSSKESLAVKRSSYEVLLSFEDGALRNVLPLNSGWLLPVITDLLRSAVEGEHRDFFRQVLDRLFVKLKISPSSGDLKRLRERMVELSEKINDILLKKEMQSASFALDVLSVMIRIFSPFFVTMPVICELFQEVEIDLVNMISGLCKRGFASKNTSIMVKAYKAWESLIGVFALSKDWTNCKIKVNIKDEQFLTMLLKPIIFKAQFTEIEVVLQKFETWVLLVKSVGRRLQHVFDKLMVPLLMYCLGCTIENCKRDTVDATVELLSAPITGKRRLLSYSQSKIEERQFVPVPKLYVRAIRLLNDLLLENGELSHAFLTPKQITEFSVLMAQCLRRIASAALTENSEIELDERQEIQAALPNLWFALTVDVFNTLEASDELEVQRRLLFTQIRAFSTVDDESLLAIVKFGKCKEFISSIATDEVKSHLAQPDSSLIELVGSSMEMIAEQPDSTSSQSVSARATRERKRKNEESTTITRRPKRACATKMAETTSLLKKQSNTTAGKGSGRQSPKRGRQPKIARKQLAKEQKAESSCTMLKRRLLSDDVKRCIVDSVESGESIIGVARRFGITHSAVLKIQEKWKIRGTGKRPKALLRPKKLSRQHVRSVISRFYGLEPEAGDEEEETEEKVENSIAPTTNKSTNTTRIPVFDKNAKKLRAVKGSPKSMTCDSNSTVSSSIESSVASNTASSSETAVSSDLNSEQSLLKSQSTDDGICTVCRASFMNSVVESPIMSASPLDQTYKEDDVNATNISPILSSGNRAPEEVEPMNVDSTAADECKPFPDSESVSLYTDGVLDAVVAENRCRDEITNPSENVESCTSATNGDLHAVVAEDHSQDEVTNLPENADSCTSASSLDNAVVTSPLVAKLIGDASPGGILKKPNSPASTKRNLRVHFEPRVDVADSQPCIALDRIASPNTPGRKNAAARGLFSKSWSSPFAKTSPGGFFVFPDSPNGKENHDASISSPIKRHTLFLPLNNAAAIDNKVTTTEQQSQRREEPITLVVCQKLAQHPADSKRMLEELKSRNITTVSALCRLGSSELDQLRIRKAPWKTLRDTIQGFSAGNNITMFKTSIATTSNGDNNENINNENGVVETTPATALKHPKDREEPEVLIMDSYETPSDKEVADPSGSVSDSNSTQTTPKISEERFQDWSAVSETMTQLSDAIKKMDPALISHENWENVRKNCSKNAFDILHYFLFSK